MNEISYHLEVFDGPLDLLLNLIAKNKVEISDIPIFVIFDQYMEYIKAAQALDMELAGEFIVMASQLMLIKSKILLPSQDEKEEDPREALANALMEYNRVKGISAMLSDYYEKSGGRFVKEPQFFEKDLSYVDTDSVARLERAFRRVLSYAAETKSKNEPEVSENTLGTLLKRGGRRIPVSARIYGIMRTLYRNGDTSLCNLLMNEKDRAGLITTFVAVLELIRSQRVLIFDNKETDDDVTLHLSVG